MQMPESDALAGQKGLVLVMFYVRLKVIKLRTTCKTIYLPFHTPLTLVFEQGIKPIIILKVHIIKLKKNKTSISLTM